MFHLLKFTLHTAAADLTLITRSSFNISRKEGTAVPACYECSFADEAMPGAASNSEASSPSSSLVLSTFRFSVELSASASVAVAASLSLDTEADPVVIPAAGLHHNAGHPSQDGHVPSQGQQHAPPPGSPLAARAKALVAAAAMLRAAESQDEGHDTSLVGGLLDGAVGRGSHSLTVHHVYIPCVHTMCSHHVLIPCV